MKRLIVVLTILLMGMNSAAWSHVRWFVRPDENISNVQFDLNLVSILVVFGAIAYVLFCAFLQNKQYSTPWLKKWLIFSIPSRDVEWRLLRAAIAILLIGNIALNIFIAPNFVHERIDLEFILISQSALLVFLVFGYVFFAIGLIAALAGIALIFDMSIWVDYVFEFMAISIAFILIGCNSVLRKLFHENGVWISQKAASLMAASVIRVGLGLQLVVLAVHNKFMNPGMAFLFIEQHEYLNFLNQIGLSSFTSLHFVLAGGLAELCFGILLILNIASRFVAMSVAFFFIMSSLILGVHELIGHIPIIACLLVVIAKPVGVSWNSITRLCKEVITFRSDSSLKSGF